MYVPMLAAANWENIQAVGGVILVEAKGRVGHFRGLEGRMKCLPCHSCEISKECCPGKDDRVL